VKINLEELANTADNKMIIDFQEQIKEIPGENIVKGTLIASLTSFGVRIEGEINTTINLECDRCLQNFPYEMSINIDEKFVNESIAVNEAKEIEIKNENFVEDLNGREEIDITDLVYQSIILNIPNKKLCDINCQGSDELKKLQSEKIPDPRMQVFKDINVE